MKRKKKLLSLVLSVIMLLSLFITPVQAAPKVKNQTKTTVMVVNQKFSIKSPVKMKYKSTNPSIVSVNSKGIMTAKRKGSAKVTGTYKNIKWTYKVKVENPKLSRTSLHMTSKSKGRLRVTGTSRKVSWSTNAYSVVSVNSRGEIHAKDPGTAVITATINGVRLRCRILVKSAPKPVVTPPQETPEPEIPATDNSGQEITPPDNSASDPGTSSGNLVWIVSTGTKYHSSSTCSRMNSPRQVSIEEAQQAGYEPCKKCYR